MTGVDPVLEALYLEALSESLIAPIERARRERVDLQEFLRTFQAQASTDTARLTRAVTLGTVALIWLELDAKEQGSAHGG